MAQTGNIHDDWRGGQLFVGNRLALDFLNTSLVSNGKPIELLPDAAALARWMGHAELLTEEAAKQLEQTWERDPHAGKAVVAMRDFRERLRAAVFAFEKREGVSSGFLAEVNSLLRDYPMYRVVEADGGGGYKQTLPFEPRLPDDLLGPLGEDTMMLLTAAEPSRVRKCEGCPVHFLDVSKKGSRRWCSMNLCGNKVKVAAYQQRKRGQ